MAESGLWAGSAETPLLPRRPRETPTPWKAFCGIMICAMRDLATSVTFAAKMTARRSSHRSRSTVSTSSSPSSARSSMDMKPPFPHVTPEGIHRVGLEPELSVAVALGGNGFDVSSYHHQAVDRLSAGLRAVGSAEDG